MTKKNSFSWIVIPLLIVACTTTEKTVDPNQTEKFNREIKEKMARETEVSLPQSATAEDQFFSVTALGAGKIEISPSKESYYYLSWSIGTQIPIECYLYKERTDVANSVRNMTEALTRESEVKQLVDLKAGVVNNRPYLMTNHFFIGQFNEKKVVTSIKIASASLTEHAFSCIHSELGYGDTFEKVFRSALEGLKILYPFSNNGPVVHNEVALVTINDHTFGFTQDLVFKNEDRFIHYAYDTLVTPKEQGLLNYQDTVHVAASRKDGVVEKSSHAKVVNGELAFQIVVEKQEKFDYAVKGKLKGEFFEKSFSTAKGIDDIFARAKQRTKGLKHIKSFLVHEYLPEINPIDLVAISYLPEISQKQFVKVNIPGLSGGSDDARDEARAKIDAEGHIAVMEFPRLRLLVKRYEQNSETQRGLASKPIQETKNKKRDKKK